MDFIQKPQILTHSENSLNYTVFDAKWIPVSAKFVTLGTNPRGTGALQIYEIGEGKSTLIHEVEKSKGFKCGTFGAADTSQRFLATGDFEGKLQIWGESGLSLRFQALTLRTLPIAGRLSVVSIAKLFLVAKFLFMDLEKLDTPVYSVKAHSQIINSIDGIGGLNIGFGAPEIVTGSRDGSVKVWDPRQKEIPVAKMEAQHDQEKRDCWAVTFGHSYNNEDRCVCAGYDNGDLKLFNLKTMSLCWERNLRNGVCCIEFDRKDIDMNKLVATTLESKFHLFDMRTQHKKRGFSSSTQKAHNSTVWCVRHLPQNRDIFMTSGGNGSLSLWNYEYPEKRYKECDDGSREGIMGNIQLLQNNFITDQPVASFDWNKEKLGLAVCNSFDQVVRVVLVTKLNLY